MTDWETLNPDYILHSQATELSDHCPLLLGFKVRVSGKKEVPF